MDLAELGMAPSELKRFHRAYTQSHGAVLVTGPTGSGKSTTLYAALGVASTPEQHIVTIEDPVEYQLDGVTQIQVNPKAGLTFATGPARDRPRRPRRDHGRRDPRPRDRADRDRGRAHRPPRALDAAHQRRGGVDHAPDRDGDRAVPRRLRDRLRRRAAPRAHALPAVQAPRAAAGGDAARVRLQRELRRRGLRAGRLQALRRLRLPRPHRDLRGDDRERRDPRARARAPLGRRDPRDGGRAGNAAAEGRRPRQGQAGPHLDRRDRARRATRPPRGFVVTSSTTSVRVQRRAADTWEERADGDRVLPDPDRGRDAARVRPPPHRRRAAGDPPARPPGPARGLPGADARGHARVHLLDPHDRAAPPPRERPPARLRLRRAGPRPLPRQRLLPAQRGRRRLPPDPERDRPDRRARPARRRARARPPPARPRARHRPDRLGQDDLAGRDDRRDQPHPRRAHRHDRGPDRVRARPPALRHQPARAGRRRHRASPAR